MKKISFICIMLLLVIGLFSASVSAATITDVYVIDTDSAIVLIKGNTEVTTEIINTSLFGVKPGIEFTDETFNSLTNDSFIFTDVVGSENDGSFEKKFPMGTLLGEGREYKIHSVNEKAETADKTLTFYTKDEIGAFLNTPDAFKATLEENVKRYAQSIGFEGTNLDISVFDSEVYLDMFIDNLFVVKSQGAIEMKTLFDVYAKSVIEMNFLKEIKGVTLQQQIKTAMDKTEYACVLSTEYLTAQNQGEQLELNLSGYSALNPSYQIYVLDTLKAQASGITSTKMFAEQFNVAVANATAAQGSVIVPGGGGAGGGGGGGGGLPPVYDITGVGQGSTDTKHFDDLANVSWAVESINALADKNIVSGVAPRTFDPEANLTREAFTKMIVLALGKYDASAKADFVDANSGQWYDSYIASAKNEGLINGMGDGIFGVGQNITRQDLAVILYKAAVKQGRTFTNKKTFGDDYEIADYAKEAVSALAGEGIISGMGDNIFAPKANATRAQAAKLIYSLIK